MAPLYLVVVALFALCHSSPVQINGEDRDGRSYTYGVGQSANLGGSSTATASLTGNQAQAYGSTLNGEGPNNALAQVGSSDTPSDTVSIPRAQHFGYYPVPTYQQKYAVPAQVAYELPGLTRAQSTAQNTPYGSAATSFAQSNNPTTIIESPEPVVIAAKTEGINAVYTPIAGVAKAASNAQPGTASSSTYTGPARRSIGWRFGTAYGTPAGYVIKSDESNSAIAKSDVNAGFGNLRSNTFTQGQGTADATARQDGLGSVAASKSQSSGLGSAQSDAGINPYGSAYYRNAGWNAGRIGTKTLSSGNANSAANAQNLGNSQVVKSFANSFQGGSASAAARSD